MVIYPNNLCLYDIFGLLVSMLVFQALDLDPTLCNKLRIPHAIELY